MPVYRPDAAPINLNDPKSFITDSRLKTKPVPRAKFASDRGFLRVDFRDDIYNNQCSVQESGAAWLEGDTNGPCIWLGVDVDFNGKECTRMHLSQATVASLLPVLIHFAMTGSIRKAGKKK